MKESFVIFIALLAPLNAINAPIKHDGKAHFHPRPRQEPNTPVQGLGELEPPTAASTSLSTSSLPNTVSSYLFPTTVIQEPVATVCPGTPASSAMFSILPISSLASLSIPNSTHSRHWKATDYIPIHVNATAMLPNGSSTVFLSASTTSVVRTTSDAGPTAKTARIILGSNGCQTVYSAVTTAWCSTTIQPAGMLPVRITDCDQQVTFSSQSLDGCSVSPSATGLSRNGPVAYFVAHWYDLVRGSIPNVVQVQDCLPASSSGLSCSTSSESWSVVTSTITSTGTSVASFSGVSLSLAELDGYSSDTYFLSSRL